MACAVRQAKLFIEPGLHRQCNDGLRSSRFVDESCRIQRTGTQIPAPVPGDRTLESVAHECPHRP